MSNYILANNLNYPYVEYRIRYLSKERNVPVFAFAEDYALSGAYWLSMAADEIYVNPSSMIGSIGVITATFGFQDAIAKLGT